MDVKGGSEEGGEKKVRKWGSDYACHNNYYIVIAYIYIYMKYAYLG